MGELSILTSLFSDLQIERITIDLPFRLNHVHCFLAEGENGWKVMDTGLHNEAAINAWQSHIKNKQIEDIILTHLHPDHIGYAGKMQKETDARVLMTEIDANLSGILWEKESREKLKKQYKECGVSEETIQEMVKQPPLIYPLPIITGFLNEGDKIIFGRLEYEVIFTPGHTEGLVCLYNNEKQILLSTDHLLPKITPNISLRIGGDENPLATYLHSLAKIKKLDIEIAIPSHGEPFYEVHRRIEEVEKHHMERLEKLVDIISDPKTAVEICEGLFKRSLSYHELHFALGETLSHLEYLIAKGKCEKTIHDGKYYYHYI